MLTDQESDSYEEAIIIDIQTIEVPINELMAPYTSSGNIVVNNIHGSCQNENDGSDYLLSPAYYIATYGSPKITQAIHDVAKYFRLVWDDIK